MRLWLLIGVTFIFQEIISTNATLLAAYRENYNPWIIGALFLGVTVFDITLGYVVGRFFRRSIEGTSFMRFAQNVAMRIETLTGVLGRRLAMVLLGAWGFPPINGFVVSTLGVPYREAVISISIGALLWYGFEWLIVLGSISFGGYGPLSLYIVLTASVAAVILGRIAQRTYFKTNAVD